VKQLLDPRGRGACAVNSVATRPTVLLKRMPQSSDAPVNRPCRE
jgi:hypothetical protein